MQPLRVVTPAGWPDHARAFAERALSSTIAGAGYQVQASNPAPWRPAPSSSRNPRGGPEDAKEPRPDLNSYDHILVNTSAGKDSLAMTSLVCGLARDQNILERVSLVHADLGKVEWEGTKELAKEHADFWGLKLHTIKYRTEAREERSLLEYVEYRGNWPSKPVRFCTSEFKRGPIGRVQTELADRTMKARRAAAQAEAEKRAGAGASKAAIAAIFRELKAAIPVPRVLNCVGIRAEESPDREAKLRKTGALFNLRSSSRVHVDEWKPIGWWHPEDVWAEIQQSGMRYHEAYDLGMSRLSCAFCIFATAEDLSIAALHNPALLDDYCELEKRIGFSFKSDFSLCKLRDDIAAGRVTYDRRPAIGPTGERIERMVPVYGEGSLGPGAFAPINEKWKAINRLRGRLDRAEKKAEKKAAEAAEAAAALAAEPRLLRLTKEASKEELDKVDELLGRYGGDELEPGLVGFPETAAAENFMNAAYMTIGRQVYAWEPETEERRGALAASLAAKKAAFEAAKRARELGASVPAEVEQLRAQVDALRAELRGSLPAPVVVPEPEMPGKVARSGELGQMMLWEV